MKKKRAKISYRDLRPPDAPPAAPSAAPPDEREPMPVAGPVAERTAPVAEPVPEPVTAPVAEPAAAPVAAPVAEPAAALEPTRDVVAPAPDEEPSVPRLPLRERARLRAGLAQLLLFRVGSEWFATDLAAAEEAIELPQVHHVPEMPESMLGMFDLRGRMIPVYAPARVLGVPLRSTSAATLVLRGGDQRVGIAVDDVEDVFTLDLAGLRDLPGADDADGVVLGVARHGRDLVAVLDADALVAACLSDRVMESV